MRLSHNKITLFSFGVLIIMLSALSSLYVEASGDNLRLNQTNYTPTYYVGQENCDDDGDGTQDNPFCTVQTGLDMLEAGDILMILDGVYEERVYLTNSGTENNPIVVIGESHNAIIDAGCPDYPCDESIILAGEQFVNEDDDNEPIYDGFFIGWSEYITLDGFTVRNAPVHGIEIVKTTGVTIQNMSVQNASLSVVNVYDSYDFKLLNNDLGGGNLGRTTQEGITIHLTHEEAVSIVNIDGFEIANNHLHDSFKEGFTIKVGSRNGTVRHNVVERLCAIGIYLDEAHDVDVFGNTVSEIGFIRNNMSSIGARADETQRCDETLTGTLVFQPDWGDDPADPKYQQEGLGFEPGNGIMLSVGDLDEGLITGQLYNVNIYQNIIHNINVGCLVLWDELRETGERAPGTLTNVKIYNNTLYNCARSREEWGPAIILDESSDGVEIYNNIIALASDSIDNYGATNITISNNLFFQAGDQLGEHSVNADPMFVDPEAVDFSLQPGSPAIDTGINVGLSYTGGAPDIGANESNP